MQFGTKNKWHIPRNSKGIEWNPLKIQNMNIAITSSDFAKILCHKVKYVLRLIEYAWNCPCKSNPSYLLLL